MVKPIYRHFGIVIAALAVMISYASADSWKTYRNERFGYSVDYPGFLTFAEHSPDGIGVLLESEDGKTTLSAYAINNALMRSPIEILNDIVAANTLRTITYKTAKQDWMTLSGYMTDSEGTELIFYQRLMINKTRSAFSGFELIYPVTRRDEIDPLIKHIGQSLTPVKPNR
ncbi:MAG: hypothetical protein JKY99_05295 [Rhizobiales bacterium]|nr:hypothetical protein [Hyphomicrobiales bacterium]